MASSPMRQRMVSGSRTVPSLIVGTLHGHSSDHRGNLGALNATIALGYFREPTVQATDNGVQAMQGCNRLHEASDCLPYTGSY